MRRHPSHLSKGSLVPPSYPSQGSQHHHPSHHSQGLQPHHSHLSRGSHPSPQASKRPLTFRLDTLPTSSPVVHPRSPPPHRTSIALPMAPTQEEQDQPRHLLLVMALSHSPSSRVSTKPGRPSPPPQLPLPALSQAYPSSQGFINLQGEDLLPRATLSHPGQLVSNNFPGTMPFLLPSQ